jgi:hypothetical protein
MVDKNIKGFLTKSEQIRYSRAAENFFAGA